MRRCVSLRCSNVIGYGPFSSIAKARVAREKQQGPSPAATAGAPNVAANVGLRTNLNLRLSLAALPHPSQVKGLVYRSPEWRRAMTQLYRTIIRLHNKTVAVSVDRSRTAGAVEAVAAVTGAHGEDEPADKAAGGGGGGLPEDAEPKSLDDCLLKYLLTPEQREFGNRFVQVEFTRNREADALSGIAFYEAWHQYVLQLASGVTARDLTEKERRLLTPEQAERLRELRGSFLSLKAKGTPEYMP